MIKTPSAGSVKTRLMPPLSGDEAATLAACFARDVVKNASRVASELMIAYAPSGGRAALEKYLPPCGLWSEQRGADLGERLERVAAQAFDEGFGPLIFIGTDSPTLPVSFITEACVSLVAGESDIALGPTEDGGYYLVGLRRRASGLFQNVAWSTPQAYAQTARNAAQMGLRLLELPRWYDIDTFPDLLRLRSEIFSDEEARRRAPNTYQWLLEQGELPEFQA